MKKVLLVTDVNFWERSSGHRVRIYSLIKYLSKQVDLTVVNTGPALVNIETFLSDSFDAHFYVLEKTKYLNSNGYGRRLKAFLKDNCFDTVIIEYIHSSYFLNFLAGDEKLILDAHDIISNRADEFRKFNYAGALYELSRETETEIFNVYNHVMVLCQPDYEEISVMTQPDKALLCPHPVETFAHPVKEKVKNIVFIASAYLANKDAIDWFIGNCWPDIIAKYDVQLIIYGTVGSTLNLQGQHKIVCQGFMANTDRIYEQADIIINPVRFGAGLKIKNMEALAHGLPLVTTAHGARGIEAGITGAFLVANTSNEFIAAVSLLIESFPLRKNLHKNALGFIEANFSADQCFGPLIMVINQD